MPRGTIRQRTPVAYGPNPPPAYSSHGRNSAYRARPSHITSCRAGNKNFYVSITSISSCERILAPQLRHTISAPGIRVSSPPCSMIYSGASGDIPNDPPHPACLLASVVIRIVSIDISTSITRRHPQRDTRPRPAGFPGGLRPPPRRSGGAHGRPPPAARRPVGDHRPPRQARPFAPIAVPAWVKQASTAGVRLPGLPRDGSCARSTATARSRESRFLPQPSSPPRFFTGTSWVCGCGGTT
jgi:hypothetical protein